MIISHKHKFIFIRTNKAAGTSIEIALSRFCGSADILTRDLPEDEDLKRSLGCRTAQNFRIPFRQYNLTDWKDVFVKTIRREKRKTKRYYNHSSASEVRRLAGEKIWSEYYKFCFERNPWDRAISYYYFIAEQRRIRNKPVPQLSDFILSGGLLPLKQKGIENYMINKEMAVDRVCLYENLSAELQYVCNHKIGITDEIILPRAKGSFRKDRRHYRDILGTGERDYIADLFSDEIRLFGYSY